MPITNYLPSSRLIQPGVCTSTTRPASPFEGQVIYETNTKQTLVWQGSAWVNYVSSVSPTFTGGQVTVSGTGDTSVKINSTSGYAIQYFAINGTNRWHYEVAPSYQTWGLVETGIAQRVTVNAGTGNLKLETGQAVTPNQYTYNGDNTGGVAVAYNGETVKPPNTYFNVGGLFNASNGRFTVPIAGYVLCSFNSLITRNLTTSHAYVEFQVDGVRKSARNHTMYDIGGNYTNLSNTAIVYCPANSYVTCNLWTPQASAYGDMYGLGLTFRFLG